jgi:Spy/CpxP family protein refolding chaperone
MRFVRSSVPAFAVVALILVSGTACQALAQGGGENAQPRQRDRGDGERSRGGQGGGGGGMFGGRGGFEASITSRSMEGYSKLLGLTGDQKAAAEALLDGYQESFATLAGEARDKMQEMREAMRAEMADNGPNPDAFRKMGAEMEKFRTSREALDKTFFNDLKAVLTPAQVENWPSVERMHRREQSIGRGVISGERVDLFRVVDDLKLNDDALKPVRPVLDEYAVELDRELATRNAAYDAVQNKVREMFQGGAEVDLTKVFDDGRAAGTRVREVNRRYARQIEGLLPEISQPAFSEAVRRASFPLIYRETYGARAIAAAAEMTELDENQKATVLTIRESYTRDLTAINKEIEAAYVKREASIKPEDIMGRRPGRGGGGGAGLMDIFNDPEVSQLVERRNGLQDAALEKLKSTLTPEQFEALPRRGGRGDEARRGGDEDQDRPRQRRDDAPRREGRPQAPRTPAPGPTR